MSTEMILMLVAIGLAMLVLLLLFMPKNSKDIDRIEEYKANDEGSIVGIGYWLLLDILMLVPFVGLFFLLYYAISKSNKKGVALKSFSRFNILLMFLPVLCLGLWFIIDTSLGVVGGFSQDQLITLIMGICICIVPLIICLFGFFNKDKSALKETRKYEFKWLGLFLISLIPIVNIIYLIVYINHNKEEKNPSLLNWAKLQLVFSIIGLLIIGAFVACLFIFPEEMTELIMFVKTNIEQIIQQI